MYGWLCGVSVVWCFVWLILFRSRVSVTGLDKKCVDMIYRGLDRKSRWNIPGGAGKSIVDGKG